MHFQKKPKHLEAKQQFRQRITKDKFTILDFQKQLEQIQKMVILSLRVQRISHCYI